MNTFALLLMVASLDYSPHIATVTRWAEFYGVPVDLALRLTVAESSMNARAVSREGSMGLLQVSKYWARELAWRAGVKGFKWWDADHSAHVGMAYLSRLHRRYGGDWVLAVAAYNCGSGRLESGRALPGETVEYLRRIFG